MTYQAPLTVAKALERIYRHEYVIPAIQREFVWSQAQICSLFDSLLRGYPIGTFLSWRIPAEQTKDLTFYDVMRDYHELKNRHSSRLALDHSQPVTAILDGQQRLTSLNIGLKGSYAVKRPGARVTSSDAYPVRRLFLDLCYVPDPSDELGVDYLFRFLTPAEAAGENAGGKRHWVLASKGLELAAGPEIFKYVQTAGLAEHPTAYTALHSLHTALSAQQSISFFELEDQSLDKVLDVFIRVNSGGTVLSKSDLLLSVATAEFVKRDARDAIHGLVDDLNAIGQGFNFSKDIVLKAGLLLTDRSDIRFVAVSFTKESMAELDHAWDEIDRALRVAVRLLASFGLSSKNMTANSVLLPIADYIHHRKLDDAFVTSVAHRADREVIRVWVIRSLVKAGVWGSGLDSTLLRVRRAIRSAGGGGFPRREIEREMAALGRSLDLRAVELEEIVDSEYKQKRTFLLLSLLYPGVDTRNEFHVDHVFPKSRFSETQLKAAGVPGDLIDAYQECVNRLGNLQLLDGSVNVAKQSVLPLEWADSHFPNATAKAGYLAVHDMHDLPNAIADFLQFFESRRERMLGRLGTLLGATEDLSPSAASWQPPAGPPAQLGEPSTIPPTVAPRPSAVGKKAVINRSLANVGDGPIQWVTRKGTHRAEVVGSEIVIEDGRRFSSPSGAADAVAGGSNNGWRVWTRNGKKLSELHHEAE